MSASLVDQLQVWGFEEGCLIYRDYSLGAVFALSPKDISCATDDELNIRHGLTVDFLNGLPTGTSLQFVQAVEGAAGERLLAHRAAYMPNDGGLIPRLVSERVERLEKLDAEGRLPAQKLYLVVRQPFEKAPETNTRRISGLFVKREKKALPDEVIAREIRVFECSLGSLMQGLPTLGLSVKRLDEREVFQLLFDQWNPAHPLQGPEFNREDVRDELVLGDLVVSLKGFALGTVYHRVLSLKIMPEQTYAAMSERLKSLPFDSKLFLSLEVLNQGREQLTLETQRRIAFAMQAGKRGVADLESQAKLRDIEAILSKRVSGQEKIFSASLTVVLRHESEETLDSQVEEVLQAFRELGGAEGMLETLAAAPIFLELALPNARSRERSRRMNSSVLADFLPIYGEWPGHAEPRVLLRNRRGGLVGFDPFAPSLTNFNQVVSGGSGSGKSFLANLLIAHLMKDSPKVFILDIGGSYRKLTENLGGQYIPLGSDSTLAFNPFDLADQSAEAVDQKIKFLVSLVELMTKEDEASGIGKLERAEIERAVKDIVRDEKTPTLSQLRDQLLKSIDPALVRMGRILASWCGDSPYGKFVDRQSNVKLASPVVCFDLKGLEAQPDLQAVCLFLITDLIWREVQRDRTSPKFVIFDECWRLMESDAGARFIGEVFRTFRKYKASAIAISQSLDDFVKSRVASGILPNASVKWILKQTGGNLAGVKQALSLNEREMKLIESVHSRKGYYSDAFLIAGDEKQVVSIESTPLEYWLATTDPDDLKAFELARTEGPGSTALELLEKLASRYPRGVSAPGSAAV